MWCSFWVVLTEGGEAVEGEVSGCVEGTGADGVHSVEEALRHGGRRRARLLTELRRTESRGSMLSRCENPDFLHLHQPIIFRL
jgi:hypothetical protein